MFLLLGAAHAGDDPRKVGETLRDALLAAGPQDDLRGRLRLAVQTGGSRPVGAAVLRTDVVTREDGVVVYRLTDRLNIDLPGLGSARLRVEADLRADMSAIRIVLETEEPRGGGPLSRQRISLERDGDHWVRSVTTGDGAPELSTPDLPERLLVLTPPVGAGERLTRLAPGTLGTRLKIPAYDLETGQRAVFRLSVDEPLQLKLRDKAVPAVKLLRREGPASLTVWRDVATGAPLKIVRDGDARVILRHPDLAVASTVPPGPTGCVLTFLHGAARGQRDAVVASLDLDALYADAGGPPADANQRALFEEVLLERLTDPEWLEARGLLFAASAADAAGLTEQRDGAKATVRPKDAKLAFHLAERDGTWQIVRLPR